MLTKYREHQNGDEIGVMIKEWENVWHRNFIASNGGAVLIGGPLRFAKKMCQIHIPEIVEKRKRRYDLDELLEVRTLCREWVVSIGVMLGGIHQDHLKGAAVMVMGLAIPLGCLHDASIY